MASRSAMIVSLDTDEVWLWVRRIHSLSDGRFTAWTTSRFKYSGTE